MPMEVVDGRLRAVIEGISPQVEEGRFAVKRIEGDRLEVEADIFVDGHDRLRAVVCYRPTGSATWQETPMAALFNDRWRGEFTLATVGRWEFTILAWVDAWRSWHHDLGRREGREDIALALRVGAAQVRSAALRAQGADAAWLAAAATELEREEGAIEERRRLALSDDLHAAMERWPDRSLATFAEHIYPVVVDRALARFGAWYEFFPRSTGEAGLHGTLDDAAQHLEYVAAMGFDVVYLPPIHPIGHTYRKGRNNSLEATPEDPGSPWAIGAEEGGHRAIHPQLGGIEAFRRFRRRAEELGLEVALDIAFQASPDHPYVKSHPEWFRHRPDGSIQYAENPPKKYQDIYPFHFESDAWRPLWQELLELFRFWIGEGVRVFRVDNPHTKPFPFWEWCIQRIKADHPETLFLAEAFSRPRVMQRLAKGGFTQSYTYFTWRNTKYELTEYLNELNHPPLRDYFRPNFWPNTPDILPEFLQYGGRPAFMARAALAATLVPSYGIYGPAYELIEHEPREAGGEEYLHSEKYELRHWPLDRPDSLRDYLARLNRIRRQNPALQQEWNLRFVPIDSEQLIAYTRTQGDNLILVVVNLDPYHTQSGWLSLPLGNLGLDPHHPYQVHDLLTEGRFLWHGERNFVQLDPERSPAHIFQLKRRIRSEREFDYFM